MIFCFYLFHHNLTMFNDALFSAFLIFFTLSFPLFVVLDLMFSDISTWDRSSNIKFKS